MKSIRVWTRLGSACLVLAAAFAAVACEDEESEITGTYNVFFVETDDTCDDARNSYPVVLEITRQGDGFSVEISGSEPLTGDFRDDGILAVSGTVTGGDPPCSEIGACPRQVQLDMDIRRGRIVEGAGRITWNGTFPGVPGVCVQEIGFSGPRENVTPIIG